MGKHRVLALNWECIPCGQDGCEGTKISDCLIQMPETMIHHQLKGMLEDPRA
jgi:heptosyltransferase-3